MSSPKAAAALGIAGALIGDVWIERREADSPIKGNEFFDTQHRGYSSEGRQRASPKVAI
jgi:hypothetical protein